MLKNLIETLGTKCTVIQLLTYWTDRLLVCSMYVINCTGCTVNISWFLFIKLSLNNHPRLGANRISYAFCCCSLKGKVRWNVPGPHSWVILTYPSVAPDGIITSNDVLRPSYGNTKQASTFWSFTFVCRPFVFAFVSKTQGGVLTRSPRECFGLFTSASVRCQVTTPPCSIVSAAPCASTESMFTNQDIIVASPRRIKSSVCNNIIFINWFPKKGEGS